jgi:flagellar biogenesis protein FliO
VIVAVEGRRLLLGMTPTSISLVTELRAVGPKGGPHGPDGGPESFFEAGR